MVVRLRWRGFVFAAMWVSAAAFVVGLVVEGFWGGTDGTTSWVDQSFGFAMYLGAALSIALAGLVLVSLLIARALRLLGNRGRSSTMKGES